MTRSKYGNKRATVDGRSFASQAEGARYQALKLLERAGEISNLRCQVRHKLLGYRGGVVGTYVADFDYVTKDGLPVTEDVKSPATAKLPVFRLKSKLFREQMGRGITITFSRAS